jgi:hypothetical protein
MRMRYSDYGKETKVTTYPSRVSHIAVQREGVVLSSAPQCYVREIPKTG